jgi:hypothetical protein
MPVIPTLGKLRQEEHKFKASLDHIVRPCVKKKERKKDVEFLLWLDKAHRGYAIQVFL